MEKSDEKVLYARPPRQLFSGYGEGLVVPILPKTQVIPDQAGGVFNFQLIDEVAAVGFHRAGADEEFGGNFFVGHFFGNTSQHLRFTPGERCFTGRAFGK
jgi:hypothetical protein